MKRYLTPIFFMLISSGIFVSYVFPKYEEIRATLAKKTSVEKSLADAEVAKAKIEKIGLVEASFPQDYQTKLRTILPDTIDSTKLIIEVNAMAERDGLRIPTPRIASVDVGAKKSAPYVKHTITYAVKAPYAVLRSHLRSLEQNLSLRDLTSMSFSTQEDDGDASKYRSPELIPHTYNIVLTTYSLH